MMAQWTVWILDVVKGDYLLVKARCYRISAAADQGLVLAKEWEKDKYLST